MSTPSPGATLTLDLFLGLLGGDFVDVLHAPAGLDVPVVAEFNELILSRPQLLQGGVAGMAVSDRDRGTEYLPSLRTFFDAGGDVAAAARTRYADVEDPTQRLVAELQLSVFTAHPESQANLETMPLGFE